MAGVDILPKDVIPDSKEEQEILFSLTDGLRAMKLAVLSGTDKMEQFESEVTCEHEFVSSFSENGGTMSGTE